MVILWMIAVAISRSDPSPPTTRESLGSCNRFLWLLSKGGSLIADYCFNEILEAILK